MRRPPWTVIAACVLILGLALFAIAIGIFIFARMQDEGDALGSGVLQFTYGLIGVKAALNILVAVFIWRGQGWSRMAYAVLTALSLLTSWSAISHFLLVGPLLQIATLVLLFVPASDRWFAPARATPMADVMKPAAPKAPTGGPASWAMRPTTLKCGIASMFLVLGLELWAAWLVVYAWVGTWPQDDSAFANVFSLIPIGGIVLSYIVMTVVLAILIWNGQGPARFVYGAMTALGLRLVLGALSISVAGAFALYAVCAGCFVLLFLPPTNRWFKIRVT
jgi:hypothetical protein